MVAGPIPPSLPGASVVLGDGRALFRASIVRLLAARVGLRVVAQAADADSVIDYVQQLAPDAAVIDLSLPGGAIETARRIRERHPRTEVVLYGLPTDDDTFVQALAAGAKGFADAAVSIDDLAATILRVVGGEVMVSPGLARHIAVAYGALMARAGTSRQRNGSELTARELDTLRLIARGHSNREAAAALGLSEHTVRAHLRGVSRKLKVQNRVQAVSEAIRAGLLTDEALPPIAVAPSPSRPAMAPLTAVRIDQTRTHDP